MRTKNLSARLLLSFVVVGSGLRVKGQSWTLTSAPVTNWTSIACSADGSKVVAASSGLIYTSTNAGKTWTTTTAPSGPWVSVASSADGVTLLAAENDHFENVAIYTSTNSGTEWIKGNASLDYYRGLTCSADGAKATVVASPRVPMADVGLIYTSTNSGIDWSGTSAPYEGWQAVACSADGSRLAAGAFDAPGGGPGSIYSSTNYGVAWNLISAPAKYWVSIASSADGYKLAAAAHYDAGGFTFPGSVYLSADAGLTWHSSTPSGYWSGVASSSDGTRLVAVAGAYPPTDSFTGSIYSSEDSGASWTSNNAPIAAWSAVASSTDGRTRIAAVYGGGIYTWHAPGTVLWAYDAGSTIASSPALGPDGTVYFGTAGTLYAITNQGPIASAKWTSGIPYVCSSPAVAADGTVYVSAMDSGTPASGYLYAFNSNGHTNWTFYSQGNGSPAIGFDNTVYVTGGARLYALAPDGTLKWNVVIGGTVTFGAPAIAPDGTIYIASPDAGSFSALSPVGDLKWSKPAYPGPGESPAIGADGTVYLVGSGLFAYRADGSSPWSLQGPLYAAPALGNDGTIYVAGSTAFGFEYGLSLNAFFPNGALRWQVQTNLGGGPQLAQYIGTPAVDAAGTVYVAALNTLFAFSPAGTVRWAYKPGDGTANLTSPTIGREGTIYTTFGSTIYAVAGANVPGDSTWPMYHQNGRHTGKLEKPVLAQPRKNTDSNFAFQLYPNQIGLTYTIEASTNLSTWTAVTNILATTLPTDVTDLTASNAPTRFYRASLTSQ